jgi:hypothetical protein
VLDEGAARVVHVRTTVLSVGSGLIRPEAADRTQWAVRSPLR